MEKFADRDRFFRGQRLEVSWFVRDKNSEISGLVVLRGECRDPQKHNGHFSFDLAELTGEQIHLVRCRLWGKNLSKVASYFKMINEDLDYALREGNALEVQGEMRVTTEGQLEFDVIKIAPNYSRPGKILRSDEETLERLRKAGVPSERLDGDQIYLPTEASPKLDVAPKKIMVISAEGSEGRADIRHAMAGIEKYGDAEVTHESVPWRSNMGFTMFKDILGLLSFWGALS